MSSHLEIAGRGVMQKNDIKLSIKEKKWAKVSGCDIDAR